MLLSLALLAMAAPSALAENIICETSDASPSIDHINNVINELHDISDDDLCFASHLGGRSGMCGDTMDFSDGNAVFMLCAGEFDPKAGMNDYVSPEPPPFKDNTDYLLQCRYNKPGKIKCDQGCDDLSPDQIADLLEELMEECKDSERAGGILYLPDGGEMKLFSKD